MADKTLLDLPILASGDIDNSDVLHAIDISDNLDKQTTTGFLAEFILQRSAFNIETISTTPIWEQVKSNNIADGKRMFIETSTDRHRFGISNDAKTSSKYFLEAIRTGNTLTQTILRGDTVTLAGNTSVSGTLGVTGLTSLSTLSTTGLATLNSLTVTGLTTVSSSGITSSSSRIDLLKGVQIGTGTAEGNLTLKQNGSDTIEGGAYIKLRNNDASDQIVTQISADGHEDKWFWNGSSWSLRERITQTGRHIIGNSGVDNGTDLLQVGSGDNISASIGELALFSDTGNAYLSHYDKNGSTTDWGFRITGAYNTEFNAPAGSVIRARINNSEIATFSGTQIDFKQGVVIDLGSVAGNPRLSFDQDLLSGNNFIQVDRNTGAFEVVLNSADVATFKKDGGVEILGGIKTDNATLKTKVIQIGTWDMSTTLLVDVTHGLSDISKVRDIRVMVTDDVETTWYPLDRQAGTITEGGVRDIDSTTVTISRTAGGFYDSSNFDNSVINRGYITITYEA